MRLPRFMLRHRITVEPYAGEGYAGATYADPAEVRCWWDGKRGSTTTSDGSTVATTAKVLADLDELERFPVGTRVTAPSGDTCYVVAVEVFDAAGLPLPEHLEVAVA